MAYKALYRTYRPSTFDEVAGQQHIVKTIKNALKTNKLAHAYLFTGPRGTGKTTMAKLLAKALNCEEGIGCQCNECKNCKAIIDGSHPDVLELDAASNNSVDDIRELIDKVKYGTILGRYKVYIIDEVHMLSTGAFNALLKTLEEPPEHVIFVLATTEPHKILPTILSRCQRYDFTKVSDNDIKERIRTVLMEENIPFNEKAVDLIISLCDGGMRDALSILDQVLRYSGDTLNEKDIMDVFAMESVEEKMSLIKSILCADVEDVLNRVTNYISKGSDLKRLTDDLLGIFKDVLIYKTSGNSKYLTYLDEDTVYELSSSTTEEIILKMIDGLLEAQKDFKNVPSISSLFQVTLLKLSTLNRRNAPSFKKEVKEDEGPVEEEIVQNDSDDSDDDYKKILFDEDEDESTDDNVIPVINPVPVPEPVVQKYEPEVEEKEEVVEEEDKQVSLLEEPIEEKPVEEAKIEISPQITPEVEEKPIENLFNNSLNPVLSDEYTCLKGSENGEIFSIEDNTIIDIWVMSKKDIKSNMLDKWSDLKKLSNNEHFGKYVGMLVDAHVLTASNSILILEHQFKKSAEKINRIENQKYLQAIINCVFKKKMFIYAMDRGESVRLQQLYLNKMQLDKLPKASEIQLEMETKR